MISLNDWKEKIIILSGSEAQHIRREYITKFVKTDSDYFKKYIWRRRQFSDGLYYTGYMWDTLYNATITSCEKLLNNADMDRIVYVFWDLHSKDRIYIKDYWKFSKDSVLKMKLKDLLYGIKYLP